MPRKDVEPSYDEPGDMLAIVAPGQGAQRPGQLAGWLEDDRLSALLDGWEQSTGLPLRRWGTDADAEEIRATAVTQPHLATTALLSAAALSGGAPRDLPVGTVSGHSVGEWSAAVIADVLDPVAGLRLVAARGAAMGRCAAAEPTTMAACLGGELDVVLERLTALGLVAANINAVGQVVAAGRASAIETLIAEPPAGSRVRPLAVEAAFHSPFMAPARAELADLAQGADPRDTAVAVISNADGEIVLSGRDLLDRMVRQVTEPVRWDLCTQRLAALGVTAVIELAPAGVLVPMLKRALPEVELLALKGPEDLDAARALIANHSDQSDTAVGARA